MQKKFGLVAALLVVPGLSSCKTPKQFAYLEKTPVRVTELHFAPSDEQGNVEFIEIANVTDESVDISGWQVTGAKRMSLPDGTELASKKVLVICRDKAALKKTFKGAKPVATFSGKLKNGGDTIRIEDPDGLVADEVTYDKKDPQVEKATGTGLSIHRRKGSKEKVIWKAAKPTPGSLKS